MQYRFLGQTGVQVSEFSLGTMTFGGSGSDFFRGVGAVAEKEITPMVHRAIAAGVNMIDTANVYSRGLSEELLGKAIKGKRDGLLICTKLHGRMSDAPNDAGQSRLNILKSCDDSLLRMGIDYIDILYLHNFDAFTRWEESLAALTDLIRAGKVRYIGCSNLSGWQMMKALATADVQHLSRFVVYQGNYSLASRDVENEILPACVHENLGFVAWSPLAGGLLTGKYAADKNVAGRRHALGDPGHVDPASAEQVFAAMNAICKERGVSAAQVALNYVRQARGVTSVLIGARSLAQFDENLAALDWSLTDEEMSQLNRASARPLPYPYWHHRTHNKSRFSRTKDE